MHHGAGQISKHACRQGRSARRQAPQCQNHAFSGVGAFSEFCCHGIDCRGLALDDIALHKIAKFGFGPRHLPSDRVRFAFEPDHGCPSHRTAGKCQKVEGHGA